MLDHNHKPDRFLQYNSIIVGVEGMKGIIVNIKLTMTPCILVCLNCFLKNDFYMIEFIRLFFSFIIIIFSQT